MTQNVKIEFGLADLSLPVNESDVIWREFLPTRRIPTETATGPGLTYGEYFQVTRDWLARDQFSALRRAFQEQTGDRLALQDIRSIQISLEKHGRFYHPAKIDLFTTRNDAAFVLNVACTKSSCVIIDNEYDCLERLKNKIRPPFVPRVYDIGEIDPGDGRTRLKMFLGEWFEGYNEFHLSQDDQRQRIVVWGPKGSRFYLSNVQEKKLYQHATYILTCYYNILTFEQIFPWHHAAGDFIVKTGDSDDQLELKLITVRQYAPMVEHSEGDEAEGDEVASLENLLIFFVNLSIRMRLDRIDGIGEVGWSNDDTVEAIMEGFAAALDQKADQSEKLCSIVRSFKELFIIMSESDLYVVADMILQAYHPQASEIPVVKTNLQHHLRLIQDYKGIVFR